MDVDIATSRFGLANTSCGKYAVAADVPVVLRIMRDDCWFRPRLPIGRLTLMLLVDTGNEISGSHGSFRSVKITRWVSAW